MEKAYQLCGLSCIMSYKVIILLVCYGKSIMYKNVEKCGKDFYL